MTRPYTGADTPTWVALSNLIQGRSVTAEAFQAEEARRDPAHLSRRWVYEEGGELWGAAHLYFFPFDLPGFLHASVLVHPEARGQGIGRSLWNVLKAAARKENPAGLAADVLDSDPVSLVWAECRGFHRHAHRFASELDLTAFDETPHLAALARVEEQGVPSPT